MTIKYQPATAGAPVCDRLTTPIYQAPVQLTESMEAAHPKVAPSRHATAKIAGTEQFLRFVSPFVTLLRPTKITKQTHFKNSKTINLYKVISAVLAKQENAKQTQFYVTHPLRASVVIFQFLSVSIRFHLWLRTKALTLGVD